MAKKPTFGELNSAEFSQEPESLEPENLSGIDLISKNNQDATKPKVIKKIVGAFKGLVFKAGGDDPTTFKKSNNNDGFLSFLDSNTEFTKHRIYVPELHAHLPDIGEDFANVAIDIASLYPYFIAQSSELKPVEPNTLVWCDFLDRENFKDPVYLGPVDDKKNSAAGAASSAGGSSQTTSTGGGSLAGSAAGGDPFGGASYKNAAGQVSYAAVSGTWDGKLPENGFTATETTVQQLVDLALKQVGKKENPMGSNGGPDIDPFNGSRKEAWCAASIAYYFRQLGAPLPGDKIPNPGPNGWNSTHSVSYIQRIFTQLGYFFQQPQAGDMIIYDTSQDPNTVNSSMHIGLVTEADGDTIRTVEGNWADQVGVTRQDWRNGFMIRKDGSRYKSKYKINGFARRPLPYAGVPDGQIVQPPADRTTGPVSKEAATHPFYYIAENGKILEKPIEMVYITGTRKLYPKKYIRALNAMMDAYRTARGKNLTIVSAYRDIEQQRVLYEAYLARNKAPPQVAPPGRSLHNNGLAIDIEMSENRVDYSGRYTSFTFNNPVNKQDVHRRAAEGEFGPVSQWLVNNCGKFGFYWDGWSYRELWHYQLNVNLARSAGLIDE
jgi:D-alanyl-D-alanine dipeptidase